MKIVIFTYLLAHEMNKYNFTWEERTSPTK